MNLSAINRNYTGTSGGRSTAAWNMTDGSITIQHGGADWNTGKAIVRCYDSANCSSGYSCIDGVCAQSAAQAGASCGEEDGEDSCGGGGDGDCTKSKCGDDGGLLNCCGPICCRRNIETGRTECSCGECTPPPPACIQFCDGYTKANGVTFPNCSEVDACDECHTCFGSPVPACVPKVINQFGGAPCWCDTDAEPPGECKKCGEFGFWTDDWENCTTCYDMEVGCFPCRTRGKCCFPGKPTAAKQTQCEQQLRYSCNEGCPREEEEEADPCVGNCVGVSWCEGDQPEPPCPPGSSCTNNGSISAGGKTCYIRTDCDKNSVPDECKECDCNCQDDCGNCEVCSSSGVCVEDPACTDGHWVFEGTQKSNGTVRSVTATVQQEDLLNGYDVYVAGAPDAFAGSFEPVGLSLCSPGSSCPGIDVVAIGTCSGATAGCAMYLKNKVGQQVLLTAATTLCPTNAGQPVPVEDQGCHLLGTWTYIAPGS